jgi:hypothetical protein
MTPHDQPEAEPAAEPFKTLNMNQMQDLVAMLAELDDDAVAQMFLSELHALDAAEKARGAASHESKRELPPR